MAAVSCEVWGRRVGARGDARAELLLSRLRHEGGSGFHSHVQVLLLLRQVFLHDVPLQQDSRFARQHHPEMGFQRVRVLGHFEISFQLIYVII